MRRWPLSVLFAGACAAAIGCSHAAPSAPTDGGHTADIGTDVRSSTSTPSRSRTASTSTSTPGHEAGVDAPSAEASAPTATLIAVSPLTLVPPFSVSIHDYYVRCPASTNALTVTMTAATGSTIALTQPTATGPSSAATVQVEVAANGAVVASVAADGGTDEYWVRCLPPDFPKLQMTPHPEAGVAPPGYYLLGNGLPGPDERGYAMMLDGNGVPVWYQRPDMDAGPFDVENLAPDTVSYIPASTVPTDAEFEVHDLGTGVTTDVTTVGSPIDLHEFRVLPTGNYLLLSNPITTGLDLTGLGTCGDDASLEGCIIQEVDPTGALVWQWNITDHFDAIKDCTYTAIFCGPVVTFADPFHCNSIDVAPDGNLLVSARNMDSVFLIDASSGAVLWKMGGSTYSKDATTYLAVTNDPLTNFRRQHDARFLPDGTISMFDDETGTNNAARAVIYSYDLTAGTASWVWQYAGTKRSQIMGSFRILSDGSRVIGWGDNEISGLAFTEVDATGNNLLDFEFPGGDQSYRVVKLETSAFDLSLLRSTAGAE